MNIKGTQSEQNLKAAFAGESQARNRYNYFAEQARAEGNTEIAALYDKFAENEKEHAKIWFKILNEGLGESQTNLMVSASGENQESSSMYPEFARQAREDGLETLAVLFEKVAAIEKYHEKKFLDTLASLISQDTAPVLEKTETAYRCIFCGNLSDKPFDVCPLCEAIGSYEEIQIVRH